MNLDRATNASTVPGQIVAGHLEAKITQFTPAPGSCPGDCDRDRRISAADLVGAMRANDDGPGYDQCTEVDRDEDFAVSLPEVDDAIRRVFERCPDFLSIAVPQ